MSNYLRCYKRMMHNRHVTATTEAWELSSLAHKINNIHDHLKQQLDLCIQHISKNKNDKYDHLINVYMYT
ncbi:putative sieve element occlusion [Helianthus anomalus]